LGTENGGSGAKTGVQTWYDATGDIIHYAIFNQVNDRYQPWVWLRRRPTLTRWPTFYQSIQLDLQRPVVWSADYWDFRDQFPTVGWLARASRHTVADGLS